MKKQSPDTPLVSYAYEVCFRNNRDSVLVIGALPSHIARTPMQLRDEGYGIVQGFCLSKKYNIPYVRTWWTPEGELWYDVGSHTEFFFLRPVEDLESVEGDE